MLALVPALLNLCILLHLLFFIPRGKVSNLFALFLLALILWQTGDVLARTLQDEEAIRYWSTILSMGWIGMAPIMLHFTLVFTSPQKKNLGLHHVLVYVPFIICHMLYVSNPGTIEFTHYDFWGWMSKPREGSFDMIQRYIISAAFFSSVILLIRHYFKLKGETNKRKKTQAILMAVGICIPAIQGNITQVILPAFTGVDVPITSTFMTFFSISVVIALGRYGLFNANDSLNVSAVLQNLTNVVFIVNEEGQIIYRNPAAAQLFKISENDVLPSLAKVFGKEKSQGFLEAVVVPTNRFGPQSDLELNLNLADEEEKLDLLISTEKIVNLGARHAVLIIAHNITERKAHLKAIQDQNKKLSDVAWTQAHMVRAPLGRILGLAAALQDIPLSEDEHKEVIQYIAQSATELDEVIKAVVHTCQPVTGGSSPMSA